MLVPASKVGSFDGEVTALFEGVRAKVNAVLGKQFDFKSLPEEKLMVRGKKVIAAGPTISICASDCVLTEALKGDTGIAKLNMAYERGRTSSSRSRSSCGRRRAARAACCCSLCR